MGSAVRANGGGRLPAGLGWFVQNVGGNRLVWHYGQDDSYAALLVRVPAEKLSFLLLASSSLISEPFRLLNGNLLNSPFALAFIRHFAGGTVAGTTRQRCRNGATQELAGRRLLARALMLDFLGHYPESAEAMKKLFARLPRWQYQADLAVLFLSTRLQARGYPMAYPQKAEASFLRFFSCHRHALYWLGSYCKMRGEREKSTAYFTRAVNLPNQSADWSLYCANYELGEYHREKNPRKAREHLDLVLNGDCKMTNLVDQARKLAEQLKYPPA